MKKTATPSRTRKSTTSEGVAATAAAPAIAAKPRSICNAMMPKHITGGKAPVKGSM